MGLCFGTFIGAAKYLAQNGPSLANVKQTFSIYEDNIIFITTKENIMPTKIAECNKCGEEYNYRRRELGYYTCLDCGEVSAIRVSTQRARENLREMAPNSFTGNVDQLFDARGGTE
tara:strand:+ start:439 stop:786 length:348 start_codon:yes stop_codon:yes gene_type:complete